MSEAVESLRRHHRELRARLEDGLKALAERGDQGHVILSSLGDDFVRYMRASEGSLYPAVAPLIRSDGGSWPR